MATEKISEIFDIEVINKQAAEVIKRIESVTVAMENSVGKIAACNEGIASSRSYEDLTKATGRFIRVNDEYAGQAKELLQLQKEQLQVEQKLQASYIETAKRVEKVRQEVVEETKAIREAVKAAREKGKADKDSSQSVADLVVQLKRQRNSVAALTAENERLRAVMKSMDYDTRKVEIEQINRAIEANTALVRLNTDAYVKQKVDVGSYRSVVEGLDSVMKSLCGEMKKVTDAGGANSDEFNRLNAGLEKAKAESELFAQQMTGLADVSGGLAAELAAVEEQMRRMALGGEIGSEQYQVLSERAVELAGTIAGVNEQIRNMEAPAVAFDAILGGLSGLAGGFQVVQGVMGVCNLESEVFEQVQAKVQSAIVITNGLVTIKAALDEKSAFMTGLSTAAQSKNIIVSKAAVLAQRAFNAAMNANPVFLLISGLIAGVAALGAWMASVKEVSEVQRKQNEVHDKAIDGYAKEKTEIEGLAGRIREGNSTREDQVRMMAILNEKYGENFTRGKSVQEMERVFVENADAFVEAAMKRAEAQAAFELAVEAQKGALEAGTKGVEEYVGWWGRLFRTEAQEAVLAEERRQKEITDMEAQTQSYLKIQAERQQGEQAAMKKSGELAEAGKKAEAEKTKQIEAESKKRIEWRERERRAAEDIMVMQWQRSAECQKKIYEDENNSFSLRTAALESYTNQMKDVINEQRDFQISSAEAAGKEKELIEAKAQDAITKIDEQAAKDREKLEMQEAAKRVTKLNARQDSRVMVLEKMQSRELLVLSRKYAKGEMGEEEYGKAKLAISSKYNQLLFALEMQTLTAIANSMTGEDRVNALKEIKLKQLEFTKYCNEQEVVDNEEKKMTIEEQEKLMKDMKIQLAQESYDAVFSIMDSMFERKIQEVDAEIAKVDEQKEHDLEVVEEMNISDEEKEARKKEIEARAEAEKEKLEKKKKKMQLQQAKADKANAMIKVGIDTALGISRAVAEFPITGGMPFVAIVAALGAVQLAAIAAQPLPQYAVGTEDHPGGFAVVGDGGKKELIKTPGGGYFVTPDTPTLVDLPKHSEVLPDFNLALKNLCFVPIVRDDVPNYNEQMQAEIIELKKAINEVTEAVKSNRAQMNINLDKSGLWTAYERQKGRTTYINERLNIQK